MGLHFCLHPNVQLTRSKEEKRSTFRWRPSAAVLAGLAGQEKKKISSLLGAGYSTADLWTLAAWETTSSASSFVHGRRTSWARWIRRPWQAACLRPCCMDSLVRRCQQIAGRRGAGGWWLFWSSRIPSECVRLRRRPRLTHVQQATAVVATSHRQSLHANGIYTCCTICLQKMVVDQSVRKQTEYKFHRGTSMLLCCTFCPRCAFIGSPLHEFFLAHKKYYIWLGYCFFHHFSFLSF